MYRAKSQGRARHEVFDARMREQAMDRLRLEAELRGALEREEFVLHYQPVISLRTRATIGTEALIRWRNPHRGLVAPMSFVPIAEDTGLVVRLGEWVIRTACRQAREWREELGRTLRITVNVAPQQLRDGRLVGVIEGCLARERIGPECLGVELVESSLIENAHGTHRVLEQLQELGIAIAVDDFGTGYSSLSYLKRFPITSLKIDRSFVQGLPGEANDTAICTAILAMAKTLQVATIAEGVETREQMEFLTGRGCDAVQGYLFSRPVPAGECLAFVRANDAAPTVEAAFGLTSLS
jgi:EAL domain-containing protein (putative c-di-GMP-specific phosphodiesterase class I)